MTYRASALCLAFTLVACASLPPKPASGPVDWGALANEETIELVTRDADGDVRETTVWLVVVDGTGTIRTGNTRWNENLTRDPALLVRMAGAEYPLRIERVTDEAARARINAAYRTKYGVQDRIVQLFRGADVNMMRLLPR